VFGPKKAIVNGIFGVWKFEQFELNMKATNNRFWCETTNALLLGDFTILLIFWLLTPVANTKLRSPQMKSDSTYLGQVIRVDSNAVEVEVSAEIPSAAPIINGRLYKIGQIGTFVKMPMGNITIYAIVSAVSDRPFGTDDDGETRSSSKFLSIQLIGEKIGDGEFEKGIGTYPTIGDEVHLVIEKDLFEIYGEQDSGSIELGKHSSSENLSVHVDTHNLILRHCGIMGSTGSGKSNTTVTLLKSILGSYAGSRVILIDPHGEYASAFPEAKVLRIGDTQAPLYIPFWLMTFEELAFFFSRGRST